MTGCVIVAVDDILDGVSAAKVFLFGIPRVKYRALVAFVYSSDYMLLAW